MNKVEKVEISEASYVMNVRSSPPEAFLGKVILKICSKLQENIHAKVGFQ